MPESLLLTGAAGFIGSHALDHFLVNTDWHIYCPISFRHHGIPERIAESAYWQANKDRVTVFYHDLQGPFSPIQTELLKDVKYIVNFAAESHVNRSITDPVPFVKNNIDIALNMLELARKIKPKVFLQVSTDEVYGAAPKGFSHPEWSPIMPSNPYSASKAAQEAIAISYWRTYGVPLIITNTMNNIGERQDGEKFVPMVIRKVYNGEKVQIHGTEDNIGSRFYLHARNHADAVLHLLKKYTNVPMFPEVLEPLRYNVVGDRELNNLEIAQMIADYMGKPLNYELVDFHSARPGHDPRYALDGTKLADEGWEAPVAFEDSLKKLIDWSLENPKWMNL